MLGVLACGANRSGTDAGVPTAADGGVVQDGGAGGPYTLRPFTAAEVTSDARSPSFQRIRAGIDLHDPPFASATLVLDLGTACYPFDRWSQDPPPAGQNWPADCDAFDRNFEVTLDEPASPAAPPALELVRAITPFGGPLHLEVDITDVANGRHGLHTLDIFIPTYSDSAGQSTGSNGSWTVSARIDVVPGPAPKRVLAVLPLLNGSLGAGESPADVPLTVPTGTTATRLEYRVTGHGSAAGDAACIGPAEEFCQRTHHLYVDGAEVEMLSPWRDDCADLCSLAHYGQADGGFDYCLQNPCGNIRSVRASRANWCPGSLTPPFTLDAPVLQTAGAHTFRYAIDGIAPGGTWRVSAVFFAFGG
jgi:hypothetical protein